MNNDEPTVAVSMQVKVNLGNYESSDVFVSLSGISPKMDKAEIEPMLDVAEITWSLMETRLKAKIEQIRSGALKPAPKSEPEEFILPFGKQKGTRLGDIDPFSLQRMYHWAKDKNAFYDFQDAASVLLGRWDGEEQLFDQTKE